MAHHRPVGHYALAQRLAVAAMKRRSPKRNVSAAELMEFLDSYATIGVDLDRTQRVYINNVWIDPIHKREIRRYRNGHVRSIRPETLELLLEHFNLKEQWLLRTQN
jgi:hypothetical protein